MIPDIKKDWKTVLITLVVFLFPILTASVKDAGSIIFVVLMLMGLTLGWNNKIETGKDEKRFIIGLLVLLVVIATGLFYTADLQEGISKFERYLRIFLVIPVYFMFRRFELNLGKVFLLGVAVAIPVLALQGWYQVEITGQQHATGAYHKIIYGDVVILFTSLLAVATLLFASKPVHYIIATLLVGSGLYASLLSGTRAAWLFIPLLLLILLFLYRNKIAGKTWRVIIFTLVSLVMLVFIVQPDKLEQGIEKGINDIQWYMKDPSISSSWGMRLNMWRNGLIMASESPLFGKGTGSYQKQNEILVEKNISYDPKVTEFEHAHSIYFHTLAENGLVGIIVMVSALFIFPFIYFYRYWLKSGNVEQRFYTLAGMVSLLAFAWFGASEMWLARNPFVNMYFMCMLVFMSSTANLFIKQDTVQKV